MVYARQLTPMSSSPDKVYTICWSTVAQKSYLSFLNLSSQLKVSSLQTLDSQKFTLYIKLQSLCEWCLNMFNRWIWPVFDWWNSYIVNLFYLNRCSQHKEPTGGVHHIEGFATFSCISRYGWRSFSTLLQTNPSYPQYLQEQKL